MPVAHGEPHLLSKHGRRRGFPRHPIGPTAWLCTVAHRARRWPQCRGEVFARRREGPLGGRDRCPPQAAETAKRIEQSGPLPELTGRNARRRHGPGSPHRRPAGRRGRQRARAHQFARPYRAEARQECRAHPRATGRSKGSCPTRGLGGAGWQPAQARASARCSPGPRAPQPHRRRLASRPVVEVFSAHL